MWQVLYYVVFIRPYEKYISLKGIGRLYNSDSCKELLGNGNFVVEKKKRFIGKCRQLECLVWLSW